MANVPLFQAALLALKARLEKSEGKSLKPAEFARLIGQKRERVGLWLKGQGPRFQTVEDIAAAVGLKTSVLIAMGEQWLVEAESAAEDE